MKKTLLAISLLSSFFLNASEVKETKELSLFKEGLIAIEKEESVKIKYENISQNKNNVIILEKIKIEDLKTQKNLPIKIDKIMTNINQENITEGLFVVSNLSIKEKDLFLYAEEIGEELLKEDKKEINSIFNIFSDRELNVDLMSAYIVDKEKKKIKLEYKSDIDNILSISSKLSFSNLPDELLDAKINPRMKEEVKLDIEVAKKIIIEPIYISIKSKKEMGFLYDYATNRFDLTKEEIDNTLKSSLSDIEENETDIKVNKVLKDFINSILLDKNLEINITTEKDIVLDEILRSVFVILMTPDKALDLLGIKIESKII